jgi:hypothetical protein
MSDNYGRDRSQILRTDGVCLLAKYPLFEMLKGSAILIFFALQEEDSSKFLCGYLVCSSLSNHAI